MSPFKEETISCVLAQVVNVRTKFANIYNGIEFLEINLGTNYRQKIMHICKSYFFVVKMKFHVGVLRISNIMLFNIFREAMAYFNSEIIRPTIMKPQHYKKYANMSFIYVTK